MNSTNRTGMKKLGKEKEKKNAFEVGIEGNLTAR